MWTSPPTALTSILLLSHHASARRHWKRTITVDACEVPGSATTITGTGAFLGEEQATATTIVMSTATVVPMPMTTAAGVFYSGLVSGTASGTAYPSGHSNQTENFTASRNHTHYRMSPSMASVSSTTTSTSLFSLNPTVVPSLVIPSSSAINTSEAASTSSSELSSTFSSTLAPRSSAAQTSAAPSPTVQTSAASSSAESIAASSTTSAPSGTSISIPFLRGVNLGGWLVLEPWMDNDVFTGDFSSAVDQWTFDSISGAEAALQTHWSTYYTEDDIKTIAATGINALRIPIGYWAYNNTNTPYIQGADSYLENAIGWARTAGMKVWVDCHGSPGSQNGFDNSGHASDVEWQQSDNLELSISVLKTMATKYGAEEYADVVVGLELTNEPISWGNNVLSVTQSWAQEAYAAVKAVASNENLVIVMHDSFVGPLSWTSIGETLINGGAKTFGVDTHLYQLYSDSDNALTQDQHITEACGWGTNLATANTIMPTYVGEWSAATNICVNPDGSTTAGTSCSVSGCQCQSADFDDWNDNMIAAVRKFVEAQLDTFEASSSGYFLWSANGPGGWGFLNGIQNGIIPNPITSRNYSAQCGSSSKRRETRGSLGAVSEAF